MSRAICAECPVQFLCKTAFANSKQTGYNHFVQRVALMRKTGCMRAARCFLQRKSTQIKQKLQRHENAGVLGGRGWIRTTEAEKQQIYSLSPLATREHAHILFTVRAGLPVYLTTAPGICQVFCRKLFCRNAGSLFPKEKHPNPQRIQVP